MCITLLSATLTLISLILVESKSTLVKNLSLLIILLFLAMASLAKNEQLQKFNELDQIILEKEKFEQVKINQIIQLKENLKHFEMLTLSEKYAVFEQLHEAYFTFNYDSAMAYALKMIETAQKMDDQAGFSNAKMKLSTTLLASGIFNETKDTLESISSSDLNDSLKIEFYYIFSRLYFDMADYYQKSYFNDIYVDLGLQYLDSAIWLTTPQSAKHYSLKGLRMVRANDFTNASENYAFLFCQFDVKGRQLAIDASTYGYVFDQLRKPDESIDWLILAAIEDITLANKENVALINLANTLFQQGNIEKSSEYLNVALDDALEFGALQRKFQISQIQPIVEAAKLQINEEQKTRIKRYASVVTVLSLVIVVILGLLFLNLQKVKAVQKEVRQTNHTLQLVNQKLREVNLIKEVYIGQFFKTNSDLIDKIEAYGQSIENKLNSRKLDDLQHLISKQNIKEEREEMYRTFDTVFLTIFPDFVDKYNALFHAEDHFEMKSTGQMNTDLRIFALIRLGISDTEKIAHILNYSVHTINTYKTKIKNRSMVPNDDFEKEIMKIQSI